MISLVMQVWVKVPVSVDRTLVASVDLKIYSAHSLVAVHAVIRMHHVVGNDLQYQMNVTFEEAVFGAEKEISVKKKLNVIHVIGLVQNQERKYTHVQHVADEVTFILNRIHHSAA